MTRRSLPATILFTDIVGSTDRVAEIGNRRWGELLAEYQARVRSQLHRSGGREANVTGDGFLAFFDDPVRAIRCACDVRDSVGELGLEVRSGIHAGQVEETGRTSGGLAVHAAARVMDAAGPGQVLISHTVQDLVAGSDVVLEGRGVHALRGVPGEWHLFAVTSVPREEPRTRRHGWFPASRKGWMVSGIVAAAILSIVLVGGHFLTRHRSERPGPSASRSSQARNTVAVLPFEVRGEDLDVWREGMVDVLSTNLDGTADLRAIDSRTVLARWRETATDAGPPDLAVSLNVARRSGARYAVLGSVLAGSPGLRLSASVYDANTARILGQAQVEGPQDSVFALVDRLSIEVLRPILGNRAGAVTPRLSSVTTSSVPALKEFLQGEAAYRRSDFRQAREAYARAVRADSTFAFAHYRRGTACGFSTDAGCSDDEVSESSARASRLVERLPEREALIIRSQHAFDHGEPEASALVRQVVERYPDDAEAWYHLGELFFHMGGQFLAEYEDTDKALGKALELDPGFTPAYLHLIGDAFMYHADSARAARLIAAYDGLASETERDAMHRVSLGLAFGDSAAHAEAGLEVDSLPDDAVWVLLTDYLMRAPFWEASDAALEELTSRSPHPPGIYVAVLFWNAVASGRMERALRYVDEPMMGGWRERGLYYAHARALPLPAGILDRYFSPAIADTLVPVAFYGGAYAADVGRWSDHTAMLARLRGRAQELYSAGDSTMGRVLRGAGKALEGYGDWKRGRREPALSLLQAGQREATTFFEIGINSQIRWWLGELLVEMGRPAEAEVYYRSLTGGIPATPRGFGGGFWQEPLAAYDLAKIYEELGEFERARRCYEVFAEAWRLADPAVQPRAVAARAAMQRLSTLQRE